MKTKTKNKNENKNIRKISFIMALFFALAQISQVNIVLGASISAGEMISLTNKSRAEAGLPSLLVNEKLAKAAREKAGDMFEFQYFDHDSPSGLTPWDFIRSAGYDYSYAGENLAIDFVTATGVHQALMESSSHRENILNSNYTEIGIAAIEGVFDGNKSIIIVEEFGAPLKKEAIVDHSPNENVELILKEKVNEINNLPSGKKNEITVEISETKINLFHIEESAVELPLEEESVNEQNDDLKNVGAIDEQDDNLPLSDLSASFNAWNLDFRLFENGQDKTLYHNYEILEGKFSSAKLNLDEKSSKADIKHDPVLLSGSLNNEKVMGLVNKAYAKDEQIKKYDYRQKPIGPVESRYFQNEFILRIFLFYAILAILLISDFVIIIYFITQYETEFGILHSAPLHSG